MSCPFRLRVFVIPLVSICTIAQTPVAPATNQKAKVSAQNATGVVSSQVASFATLLTLTGDNLNPTAGQKVHFTGTWNKKVYRVVYHFDWGDGQSTDSNDPQGDHAFLTSGSYTVRVTARSASPTLASRTTGITSNDVVVSVAQPPPANQGKKPPPLPLLSLAVTADPPAPLPNQSVHFAASWDQRVYGPAYHFDWGDGQSSQTSGPDAYHAYSAPGTYTVRVAARGLSNDRRVSAQSDALAVNVVAPPRPPAQTVATLTADHAKVRVGEPVTFTAGIDPPSSKVQYHFDFGDGSAQDSSSNEVTYSYRSEGSLLAAVTASIDGGDETVSSRPITLIITPKIFPKVNLEVLSKILVSGQDVSLKASLAPAVQVRQYQFDWGDDSRPDVARADGRATHRYAQKGSYNVIVTASTVETYPVPLVNDSLTLVISRAAWPPTLGQLLMALAAAIAAIYIVRKYWPRQDHPGLRVTGSSDAGNHTIVHINPSIPHVSLILKPGMGSADHEIVFPKRSAASD